MAKNKAEAGSRKQVFNVASGSREKLFNKVNEILGSEVIEFRAEEEYYPNEDFKDEKTLEEFLKISKSSKLRDQHELLGLWWEISAGNKATWDFISTCMINGEEGLLIIEAKSHKDEMKKDGKTIDYEFSNSEFKVVKKAVDQSKECEIRKKNSFENVAEVRYFIINKLLKNGLLNEKNLESLINKILNHRKIEDAIKEAKIGLSKHCKGINISHNNCYQLSNRIAHTWKLASLGIPTILLYLGFTNDPHWDGKKDQFKDAEKWKEALAKQLKKVKASELFKNPEGFEVKGTHMYFIYGTLEAEKDKP